MHQITGCFRVTDVVVTQGLPRILAGSLKNGFPTFSKPKLLLSMLLHPPQGLGLFLPQPCLQSPAISQAALFEIHYQVIAVNFLTSSASPFYNVAPRMHGL